MIHPRDKKSLTHGAIATIIILSLLNLLVLLGTIVDLILILQDLIHLTISLHYVSKINYSTKIGVAGTESAKFSRDARSSCQALIDTKSRRIFLAEFSAMENVRRMFTTA